MAGEQYVFFCDRVFETQGPGKELQWFFEIRRLLGKKIRVVAVVHDTETQAAQVKTDLMLFPGCRLYVEQGKAIFMFYTMYP